MKVLIIGSGGREHALVWKACESHSTDTVFCAPGNAGTAAIAENVPIGADDLSGLCSFAEKNKIDLTIVGPEQPLTDGIVDMFQERGLKIFGPDRASARLEGSKAFAKQVMQSAGIPTADFVVFSDPDQALSYCRTRKPPFVVKADGLAAGKGVIPCKTADEALAAVDKIMIKREFGDAGSQIVIEDFLDGEEASFICITDGTVVLPLPSSQDHKPAYDNDSGPNTGGMGAYSPAPVITDSLQQFVLSSVMEPLIQELASRGISFRGVLYAGLMIKNGLPYVLEFNVRFGDPETQPILYRLQSDLIELCNASIDGTLESISLLIDPRPSVCVVMASGGYPGSYKKGFTISGLDAHADDPDSVVFHAGTTLHDTAVVTNGGRVLGVTARDATLHGAVKKAYHRVSAITWQDVHYRTDIGSKALNR